MQQNVIVKRCSVVFIVNFERISYLVQVFFQLWTSKWRMKMICMYFNPFMKEAVIV